MAKAKGMHGGGAAAGKKQRGRSSIGNVAGPSPTRPNVPQEMEAGANRAGPGKHGNKHRGDRRDMSPTYTGNAKHAARGNNPRKDVSTRAR